jgi:hypothetical protein
VPGGEPDAFGRYQQALLMSPGWNRGGTLLCRNRIFLIFPIVSIYKFVDDFYALFTVRVIHFRRNEEARGVFSLPRH